MSLFPALVSYTLSSLFIQNQTSFFLQWCCPIARCDCNQEVTRIKDHFQSFEQHESGTKKTSFWEDVLSTPNIFFLMPKMSSLKHPAQTYLNLCKEFLLKQDQEPNIFRGLSCPANIAFQDRLDLGTKSSLVIEASQEKFSWAFYQMKWPNEPKEMAENSNETSKRPDEAYKFGLSNIIRWGVHMMSCYTSLGNESR